VSEQQDQQEIAEMAQVNQELTRALRLCHSLVDDYRSKLTVGLKGSADFQPANDDNADDTRLG
jgi:hypothetical protein